MGKGNIRQFTSRMDKKREEEAKAEQSKYK